MLSDPGWLCKHRRGPARAMGAFAGRPGRRVLSPRMQKIMIIRHAEKHQHGMGHGVDEDGNHAAHELTVRGWQRAGALVHFFRSPPPASPIQPPKAIFASAATRDSPSKRAMHTVKPLAAALGVAIHHQFPEEEERALAAAVLAAPSPVLIVWHHGRIVELVHAIAGAPCGCPRAWPDERFDVVWILERDGAHGPWRFSQVAQGLLAGDAAEVI